MPIEDQLVQVMLEHVRTPNGPWIDCSCGWESNHPLLPTAEEAAALADPELPDPPDRTGEPDPEHTDVDLSWLEHVAAIQASVLPAE